VVRLLGICARTDNLLLFLGELAGPASIDLSKATKLKDVVFRPEPRRVEWVITTLQTITLEHRDLRQISIHLPDYLTLAVALINLRQTTGEAGFEEWLDLDRLLIQFWESRSIRPNVKSVTGGGMRDCIGLLLPQITKRGVIDILEH
jgi:hypothetical protein